MKTNICRVCLSFLLIFMLCLTSCSGSFFVDDASGNAISHIDDELLADGRTKITIHFANEDIEPKVFYLPQGATGESIKKIDHSIDPESHSTLLTISFTGDVDPVTLSIPHGVYIYNVISAYDDETKSPYLLVQYSDGSTSNRFYLPKGEKGNGIKSFDYTKNNDNSITIEVVLDDGTYKKIPIPAPIDGIDGEDGEDGKGIASINYREDGTILYLDIEYTNGDIYPVPLERPYKWYQGGSDPNNILNEDGTSIGHDGDYFFDTDHVTIYVKEQGSWNMVISFRDLELPCEVTFDLNDAGDAAMPLGSLKTYRINHGTYFSDASNGNNSIPVPTRDGYNFVGWCTKSVYDPRVMSFFTDLTPVSSDLTLYAIWEAK